MGIKLKNGEIVTIPPVGETELSLASDGTLQTTDSDGVTADVGGGGAAETAEAPADATTFTAALNVATTSLKGLMSAADKTALGGLEWTEVTVTPGQNVDITVAGNTAYCIEVSGYVVNGNTGPSTISIQPNASAANGYYQECSAQNTTPLGFKSNYMGMAGCGTSLGCFFNFRMFTKTGIPRFYTGTYTQMLSSTVIDTAGTVGGVWTDTATVITSIRLHSDMANGFQAGTVIRYRIIPLGT